ncbi:insulinase family protein [bacterium]|nr:insulinase family protein [bacterium]
MNISTHTLSNGCRVLIRPTPYKQILSIVATVEWGGRDDPPELAGRTNLMSRLLTQGTETRSAFQIAEAMESIGGSIDAECGHDWISVETQTVEADWRQAVDLLSDCLFHSVFEPAEFEKERALVQSEIRRRDDHKFAFAYRHFQRLFYRGHPYAITTEGEEETLAALERDSLLDLYSQAIRPDRMLLVAVGNVPESEFLGELEKCFPQPSSSPALARIAPSLEPGAGRGETQDIPRNFEQGFVIVGYPGPLIGTDEGAALRLACAVLGEGMSSRLFSRLRDRDHLAYQVGASLAPRQLASHLLLFIGTGPDTVDQACEGMIREAQGIVAEPPSPEELDRALQYVLGKFLVGRQTNGSLAHFMSAYELLGLGWEWGEIFPDRIRAVKPSDIQDAARAFIQNPAIAIVRPTRPAE